MSDQALGNASRGPAARVGAPRWKLPVLGAGGGRARVQKFAPRTGYVIFGLLAAAVVLFLSLAVLAGLAVFDPVRSASLPVMVLSAIGALVGIAATWLYFDTARSARRDMERLAASEARFRGLADAQADFILRRTPAGTVTYANKAIAGYFGLPAETLCGRPLRFDVLEGPRRIQRSRP